MPEFSRRFILAGAATAAVALSFPGRVFAQKEENEPGLLPGAAEVTRAFAEFTAATTFAALTPDAIHAAKRGIIDTLGVTLGASSEAVTPIVRKFAADSSSRQEATILGGRAKVNANLAAYVNGTQSHALDYDNVIHVDNVWMGHPSVVVLPAVLAIAEKMDLSGRDLLLGYCLGIELYTKIGLVCGNRPYEDGWHNTPYLGTMAAAGAVARLIGLDARKTARAFGVAGSSSGGLRQNFGTMTKPLHAGLAARAGVEAAELAGMGLTASEHIFEGLLGYRNAFVGGNAAIGKLVPQGDDQIPIADFRARLGAPWNISSPGMAYKICPSCRSSHYGLEAGLEFRREKPFAVADITSIECHVSRDMGAVLFYHDPVTGLQGKFSLEYVLARTLLDGVPKTTDFTDARVNDPAVKALIAKMKWLPFDKPPKDPGFPTFVFRSVRGPVYSKRIEVLTGEPAHPVSDEILVTKFDDLAGPVLSADARRTARKLVFDLENVARVRTLTTALAG